MTNRKRLSMATVVIGAFLGGLICVGLGKNYGDTLPEGALVRATIMTALFAVAFLGVDGLLALVLAAAVSRLSGRYYQRKIGGITGDTLGATNVLCEVAVLMFVAAG